MYPIPLNYTLKNGSDGTFCYPYFNIIKKIKLILKEK